MELLEQLRRMAADRAESEALREALPPAAGGRARTVSFGELWQRVGQLAGNLRNRLPPQAVVMLALPNQVEYTIAYLAVLQAGGTVFPVSPELAAPELRAAAQTSGATAILGVDRALAAWKEAPHPLPLDLPRIDDASGGCERWMTLPGGQGQTPPLGCGMVLQSSGTTGGPKMIFRSAAALDAMAGNVAGAVDFTPDDQVLASAPLCHSYGVEHGLLAPLWAGSCVHLCRGFHWHLLHRELAGRLTIFPGVPFMFELLTQAAIAPQEFPRLRCAYSAGGALPASIFEAFKHRFGLGIGQVYGATEIGSVTYGDGNSSRFDPASVGWPMRAVEIRILNADAPKIHEALPARAEGHVAVRAPSMLSRYVGDDQMPTADGFFLTGDLGRLDDCGALTPTGRLKLLIDIGGQKVNPLEVEDVIAQHPSIGSCVVVPMRLSSTLNRLRAVVTPRQAGGQVPVEELRQFIRSRVAAYKVPRVIDVRTELPRSPTGKILRQRIAEQFDDPSPETAASISADGTA